MKIPKRTVALPDSRIEWRLLTEAELADLEARANAKPQAPVEVIARARKVERNLVTLAAVLPGGTEAARVIRDLLTAVEAAPCPHEDAEWCVAVSGNGYWCWGPQGDRRCRVAETICPDCGELLPPAPQKPVEDMSAEECEAELDAAEGVQWVGPYKDGYVWCVTVVADGEFVGHGNMFSAEGAFRGAVRALRAHREREEEGEDNE